MASSIYREDLVKESRAVKKRFKGQGIKVKAGIGGTALVATGSAAVIAGAGVGMAAVSGSSAAASVAGAAVVGVFAAPVLIIGGVVRSVNTSRVGKEILKRATSRPVFLNPGEVQSLDVFFPIAPSPKKIELTLVSANGESSIFIDTSEILRGLHLGGKSE